MGGSRSGYERGRREEEGKLCNYIFIKFSKSIKKEYDFNEISTGKDYPSTHSTLVKGGMLQ